MDRLIAGETVDDAELSAGDTRQGFRDSAVAYVISDGTFPSCPG